MITLCVSAAGREVTSRREKTMKTDILWINYTNSIDSHSAGQSFEVYAASRVTIKVLTSCRILLMSCHTSN